MAHVEVAVRYIVTTVVEGGRMVRPSLVVRVRTLVEHVRTVGGQGRDVMRHWPS